MDDFSPTDLKSILHSKRANIYYLQHCRVLVNGGRVEYVTDEGKKSLYWNIPIANTTVVMLGTGTSVTQAAMREFAKAGVLVGFCGGGGAPLFAANEVEVDVSWLTSQSEYRPTEYLQSWVSFWFDDQKRLQAAIAFQKIRIEQIRKYWLNATMQREENFSIPSDQLDKMLDRFKSRLIGCQTSNDVLTQEAGMTKALYKLAANAVDYGAFTRAKRGTGVDIANGFLDHGNYLAYGLAATAVWVIGLPHGLAVLHGKTRRGGLVFDVADLIKDALVLPQAFIAAMAGEEEQEFRQRCLRGFHQEGLKTLRKLLCGKARRNTAVACHWIKSGHTELLWIVGNLRRFNAQGTVPTNTTSRDILRAHDENQWRTGLAISLLASIAGLFHDFGKANTLFQKKLCESERRAEPVRHEWVSLRLFEALVRGKTDQQWLQVLADITQNSEVQMLKQMIQDHPKSSPNPFKTFKDMPIAEAVAWLIVSHHRLPMMPKSGVKDKLFVNDMALWRTGKQFKAYWNSEQFLRDDWQADDWKAVWDFPQHTPMASATWRRKAQSLAQKALKHRVLFERTWMEDRFSLHLARLSLMLADHYYSSLPPEASPTQWRDPSYQAYANTDRNAQGQQSPLKQKLDEHNIGVAHNAYLLAKSLPRFRRSVPVFSNAKPLKKRTTVEAFRWQNKAYDLARSVKQHTQQNGFFGVNMASTGTGKTFANARIMYGLSDERLGCRFSVALGLRTLTLQTGDALAEKMRLESDDLAVLIGSQAVQQLHQRNKTLQQTETTAVASGSESAEPLYAEHHYVRYDGCLDDGPLGHWLKQSRIAHQLVSAPVLVSTIDHLMPACESQRGGKQIAPMLRLLTADLVLDEPDDFGLEDMPALCRLVNWAGLLGSRVLLSSATLPPALVAALFAAYQAGRQQYTAAVGEPGRQDRICCAWFDEFDCSQQDADDITHFQTAHEHFVHNRITKLEKQPALRLATLLPITPVSSKVEDVIPAVVEALMTQIIQQHDDHHQASEHHTLSVGLLRMANIKPLVAVARALFAAGAPADYHLHLCVYHSQYPLLLRSNMESVLDKTLNRYDETAIWRQPQIQSALAKHDERHHVFIVLATSVAEVGRDHDYDWAIAEPSSMRSLIQLAGRIQRHRQQPPEKANVVIWRHNIRALKGEAIAFCHPGFESREFPLRSKDLAQVLVPTQYQNIHAIPRIRARTPLAPESNLVDLEHAHLAETLFGEAGKIKDFASLWWREDAHWCYELQRLTPFRQWTPDEIFVLHAEEEDDDLRFYEMLDKVNVGPCVDESRFDSVDIRCGVRVSPWLENDAKAEILALAQEQKMSFAECCLTFCEFRLRVHNKETPERWYYHPWLGVFGELR